MRKKSLIFSCLFVFSLGALCLPSGLSASTAGEEATLQTFAPLYDYRSSPAVDYASLHLLGPIIKYESKADEVDLAVRPLFYRSSASERAAVHLDLLFPLFRYRKDGDFRSYSLLKVINFDRLASGAYDDTDFSIYPLVFYRKAPDQPSSLSVLPFGGTVYNRLGRDKISYALWPLYVATDKGHTHVDNYLWPFFARISGDSPDERGFKFWPLFGKADYPGVYRKFFLLWPFWFDYDEELDTDNPISKRYFFPFYLSYESPQLSRRTALWPFFSYLDDRKRGYTEWNFPWPLWQRATGEYKHGWRFLPFYADVTRRGTDRLRWYLWPLLKHDSQVYEEVKRRRYRVLYFLYRDLQEKYIESDRERSRRQLLWPLFGYQKRGGVSHFYTLALLEPLFPESDGLERNWSPLWRLYQKKWDRDGNSVTSFLWNLYWSEFRPDSAAWELFPLASWYHQGPERRWSFLKGLVAYQADAGGAKLKFFYLPWGIPLGGSQAPAPAE